MNSPRVRVHWLPAHPSAGAVSMLRHWRELDHVARAHPEPGLEISCPLGAPPDAVPRVGRLGRAWAKYATYPLRVGLGGGADVVHVLDHAFAHLLRFAPRGSRRIVTVHDLAPLDDGTLTAPQLARFRRTLAWLNHADLLLPVSEFTAARLREFLTRAPRIEVLPMGVDVAAFSRPRELPRDLPPAPRLLSIGTTLPRKNLAVLPAILERVTRDFGPVSLVRVGGPLPAALRAELDARLGPGRLVELGYARDEELIPIYQASDVLVFPSTLEGFGLPIAEAMAAGCAVVSSHAASLPEVGGDAAFYFDPHDPAAAAARIIEVLSQPRIRAGMIERGRRRARELSWENHFTRLAAIYRTLATAEA